MTTGEITGTIQPRRPGLVGRAWSGATTHLGSRLFRKYVALFVAVVCVALLTNGLFEIWFSYQENKQALTRIQREQAEAAAAKIGQFIKDIEGQIGWTTQLPWTASALEQRRFDALRLLRQVPAITELAQLDSSGKEQLRVSRLAMDAVGVGTDFSKDPKFTEAVAKKVYYGPVYFRRESEPYMTLAMAGARRDAGVSVAEVNLKFIWDVVSQIKVGKKGQAFVIDSQGRLIAHPDISLVLRNTDLSRLDYVREARDSGPSSRQEGVEIVKDVHGREVLTAHAPIPPMQWLMFVELPIDEAYAPLYESIKRSSYLLLGGLTLAFLAGLFLARKMIVPIQQLREGAAQIGSGNLEQRISIKTGDELESLADQFNDMAGRLEESYADLEKKVELRTHELSESLAQQTATSEVLQVISRSPGALGPVFQTMLENAVRICEAAFGSMLLREGDGYRRVAMHNSPPAFAEFNARTPIVKPEMAPALRRFIEGKRVVHIADIAAEEPDDPIAKYAGARTLLVVPMLKENELIGAIGIYRQEVRPFTDKQIELVTNFAAQAVIAIENVRLLNELRESLSQQTATSDVLQVISSSPGELEPVFQAMLENAVRICEAAFGAMALREGDSFRRVALHNAPPQFADLYEHGTLFHRSKAPMLDRAMDAKAVVHVTDIAAEIPYEPLAKLGGARSVVTVPMLKENELVGAISIYRQEVRPFTDKQIELVTNFANQAVIAIENVRLLNELRESLAQQTATSDVLQVISSSPGELKPVFQAMLENAVRICEARFGNLLRYDDGTFHDVSNVGAPAEFEQFLRRGPIQPGPGTGLERIVTTKAAAHIPDIRELKAYANGDPFVIAGVEGGIRTLLVVPMLKESELVGVIGIYRMEVRPFTDKQIELVTNFAAQAVIAIENVRLLNELRESLAQQTATSEVLQVISSSPGELEPVFQAMLANAVRICEAKFGQMFLVDNDNIRLAANLGVPPALGEFDRQRGTFQPPVGGPISLLMRTKEVVQVDDIVQAMPEHPVAKLGNGRSLMAVPMLKEDHLIGAIAIYRQEVRPFTDKQIELVANFANQAVIAIENVRLLNELRARTDDLARSVGELQALGEVGQAVNSTLDLETVLTTIVQRAVQLSRTDAGAIYVFDEERQQFRLRATYGMSEAMIVALTDRRIGPGDSNIAPAITKRQPVQIPDVRNEPPSPVNDIILREGYRAILVVPLLRPDHIVGALVVRRRQPGEFPQSAIDLLETFADQSVVAIQNARLFSEIEEKGKQLAVASQHKSQFLANMSHELRTPLNAILGYTELIMDNVYGDTPDKMRGVLQRVESNGRHLLGLINDVLDLSKIEAGQLTLSLGDYSLKDVVLTVFSTVESLATEKNIALKVDVPTNLPSGRGDERRLTQVLLNLVGNAIKFTDVGEVTIKGSTANGSFNVSVRDTGPGISKADQAKLFEEFQQADNSITRKKGGTGLGLAISKRIIELHGGRIWLESAPGEGSTFSFSLPVMVEQQAKPS